MSPLAMSHTNEAQPRLAEGFELFIKTHKLNGPVVHMQRFDERNDHQHDENEAMAMDVTFCTALE